MSTSSDDAIVWQYDIHLLTDPFVMGDMLRVIAIAVLAMPVLVGGMGWLVEGEVVLLPWWVLAIAFGVMLALMVVAMLLLGNRHGATFTVSEQGAGYAAGQRERRINRVVTVLGALAGSATTAGAGALASSREEMLVPWDEVERIVVHRRQRVIVLRDSWHVVLRLHCPPELFEPVLAAVGTHHAAALAAAPPAEVVPRKGVGVYAARVAGCAALHVGSLAWSWIYDDLALRVGALGAFMLALSAVFEGVGRRAWGLFGIVAVGWQTVALVVAALEPVDGMFGRSYVASFDTGLLALSALSLVGLLAFGLWRLLGRVEEAT